MQFIYVDDYGNTGRNLLDKNQPVFLLFAVFFSADKWLELESKYNEIIDQIVKEAEIENDFEFHSAKFFSIHNKKLSKISLDRRAELAYEIVRLAYYLSDGFICSYVDKKYLHESFAGFTNEEIYESAKIEAAKEGREIEIPNSAFAYKAMRDVYSHPYPVAFIRLIGMIQNQLNDINDQGIIFIDQQEQYGHISQLKMLSSLRNTKDRIIHTIIENIITADSKINVLMQIADLLAYYTGHAISSILSGKRIIERHEKSIDLILNKVKLIKQFESSNAIIERHLMAEILISEFGVKTETRRLTKWLNSEEEIKSRARRIQKD